MRKRGIILGTTLSAAAVSAFVASAAMAGTIDVTYDSGAYHHTYTVTYTCGSDGSVAFSGTGAAPDYNVTEVIDGALDTTAGTFTLHSVYDTTSANAGYSYDASGTIPMGAALGTYPMTVSTGTNGVTDGTGSFTDVPNCTPAPVVGNHGQYVSGAAHAGIKGTQLAAIAKNSALVGPYPG